MYWATVGKTEASKGYMLLEAISKLYGIPHLRSG